MDKKEELRKQLADIEKKELQERINLEYPKFKELIGTCYKYKNSYSCPEKKSDYWYTYMKILSITPNDLYLGGINNDMMLARCKCFKYQIDKYGEIKVNPVYETFVHSLGQEISIDEFNKKYKQLISNLLKNI